jgi:hypothetical protein
MNMTIKEWLDSIEVDEATGYLKITLYELKERMVELLLGEMEV